MLQRQGRSHRAGQSGGNFNLTAKDVGQTRTEAHISVTLLALGKQLCRDRARATAPPGRASGDDTLNPLIIQARDATGSSLHARARSTKMPSNWRFTSNNWPRCSSKPPGVTPSRNSWIDEQKAFEQKHPSHYSKVYFNGTVDTLQVNVLDFSSATVTRKTLDLPVRMLRQKRGG
jgi:hypothetical protein